MRGNGNIVWVTGATSGISGATARACAAAGANVVITAVDGGRTAI